MKKIKLTIAVIMVFLVNLIYTANGQTKVKVLEIGDSTTEGGKPLLENSIQQLIAAVEGLPPVEVINSGVGGETADKVISSGRYDKQIKGMKDVDYIFVRYGINDWIFTKPFTEKFPADLKNLVDSLKSDFPKSKIILMTIIPFHNEVITKQINDLITQVAASEKVELFDLYTPYQKKVEEFGRNALTVRFFPLSGVPENYRSLVAPFTKYYEWKKKDMVRVQTNEFDPLFGNLPDWYKDSHPNTTGYRIIADETAKFLIEKLKNK